MNRVLYSIWYSDSISSKDIFYLTEQKKIIAFLNLDELIHYCNSNFIKLENTDINGIYDLDFLIYIVNINDCINIPIIEEIDLFDFMSFFCDLKLTFDKYFKQSIILLNIMDFFFSYSNKPEIIMLLKKKEKNYLRQFISESVVLLSQKIEYFTSGKESE